MNTYYQITSGGKGYPSIFQCEACFEFDPERIAVADEIERVVNRSEFDPKDAGTFCDSCNAPLATPDSDVVVETLHAEEGK